MNGEEAAQIMAYITAAYPRSDIPKETAAVFARELAELPIEVVTAAVREHIRTSKFPPTIAEIRALATQDRSAPTALEAWMEVEQEYTPYGSPDMFSHSLVGKAFVAVFGSNRFGPDAWLAKFDEWTRKAYLETYEGLQRRDDRDRALGIAGGEAADLFGSIAQRMRLNSAREDDEE